MELYEYWHVTWRAGRASPYIRTRSYPYPNWIFPLNCFRVREPDGQTGGAALSSEDRLERETSRPPISSPDRWTETAEAPPKGRSEKETIMVMIMFTFFTSLLQVCFSMALILYLQTQTNAQVWKIRFINFYMYKSRAASLPKHQQKTARGQ